MTKNLENKTKKSFWNWNEIKTALKVSIPFSILVSLGLQPIGGYLMTKRNINSEPTNVEKRIVAETYKEIYQDANTLKKGLWIGSYLAANQYLKNNQ